ncbi:MAG: replication-associated recombination protein A [Brevibacterium yomogidense]|uniref:ATPase, AAA family n=1 Tax=Brevibacterium yomogidense TaxID=946573 RepID=A0A1X6XGL0_9MICO|nr:MULTISPECIES: replication-associated recombination protein A [Brevibacterium]SLM98219.1 ATPase, AAA family [Brevibacterium yomogidense]SMX67934.1 Recombination protein MgsA [Brevibacterium sp. Mu109]
MRPRALDEVVGQDHLTFPGSPLRQLVEAGSDATTGPASVMLWGPPGVGKTTLAHVISHAEGRSFVELSAITAGVRDVRQVVESARQERELHGRTTVLFLDEIHRFTKAQQDALLPAVENRLVVLVAATTENPSFSVIAPLLSRSLLLTLRPLDDAAISGLLERAIADPRGLAGEFSLTDDARDMIVRVSGADARRSLTILEAAAGIARARAAAGEGEPSDGGLTVTEDDVSEASAEAVIRYDRDGDQHYDVVSAFIKSIRGSDPDAALHYLARMIVAGEDPRFICRRVVISASEDIGMADPHALTVAVSAHQAVERIGMPEGRIPLAEAVVYLATAPKSNASYRALDAAIADVKQGRAGQVPLHLRDAHYPGAKALGHGEGYLYSHDWPYGVSPQSYLPESLTGSVYYRPTPNGAEARMADRLASLEALRRDGGNPKA